MEPRLLAGVCCALALPCALVVRWRLGHGAFGISGEDLFTSASAPSLGQHRLLLLGVATVLISFLSLAIVSSISDPDESTCMTSGIGCASATSFLHATDSVTACPVCDACIVWQDDWSKPQTIQTFQSHQKETKQSEAYQSTSATPNTLWFPSTLNIGHDHTCTTKQSGCMLSRQCKTSASLSSICNERSHEPLPNDRLPGALASPFPRSHKVANVEW